MAYSIIKLDGAIVGIAEQEGNGIGALQWFHRNKPSCSMSHACEHEGYSVEDVEELHYTDAAAVLVGIIKRLGLSVESTFVPFSASENAKPTAHNGGKPWRSLNWVCTINRTGMLTPRAILEGVTYAAGVGHCPAEKRKWDIPADKERAIALEIEQGRPARPSVMRRGQPMIAPGSKMIEPDPLDVIGSLAMDSSVLDAGGFEDWAADYGYDTDSRKAEAIYRLAVEQSLKLQAAVGSPALEELRIAANAR